MMFKEVSNMRRFLWQAEGFVFGLTLAYGVVTSLMLIGIVALADKDRKNTRPTNINYDLFSKYATKDKKYEN